jgi:hypothetical protein
MVNVARLTVLIAGTEYTDIKSYTIDSNILTLMDAFEIQLANADGVHSGAIEIGDPVAVFIPPVCFEAGQQIGETMILYGQRAHQLVNVSSDGYLQIFTPRYDTPAAFTLHYHKASESARRLNKVKPPIHFGTKIDGVYTHVTCVGTVAVPSVMPSRDNPHAGTFRGEYTDETALPFNLKRLLTLTDGDTLTKARADNRAKWKANRIWVHE